MSDATQIPPTGQQGWPQPAKRRRTGLWITLAVVGVLFIGCTAAVIAAVGSGTDGSKKTASTPSAATTEAAPTTAGETATTAAPASPSTYRFGRTAEWEDGTKAVVLSARRTTFGQYAQHPGPGVKITVRITNGTSEALDIFPTLDVRLGTAGTTAEQEYAEGCTALSDLGRLAPSRTVSGTMCFSGRGGPQIDVSFAPTMGHDALTWTGAVTR